jgi:hypothetical protein
MTLSASVMGGVRFSSVPWGASNRGPGPVTQLMREGEPWGKGLLPSALEAAVV